MKILGKLLHALGYTLPAIVRPLVAHILGRSPTSTRCKLRIVTVVAVVRALFNDPSPVSMLREQTDSIMEKEPGKEARGSLWIAADAFPVPASTNLEEKLAQVIDALGPGINARRTRHAVLAPVRGEWVEHRGAPGSETESESELLSGSTKATYQRLAKETQRSMVILFLHGGQFYMRSPASRRGITGALCKLTGGRCFVLQYRLSPQHPFPMALLDCLVAYVSLLYPPLGSLHAGVSASNICLAGDSSGANICLGLVQTILELQRQSADGTAWILWDGEERKLPLPVALTAHSAFLDLTRSLPSEEANLSFDVLPPPRLAPFRRDLYPPCEIWPAKPMRNSVYADDEMLTHPLVSPVVALDWRNCRTRIWFGFGEECLADGNFITARQAMAQGATVRAEQYAGMPHDFTLLFPNTPSGQTCLSRWAAFLCEAVDTPQAPCASGFAVIGADGKVDEVEAERLVPSIDTEKIKDAMEARVRDWNLSQMK